MNEHHHVLQATIRKNHGCDCYWLKSVDIKGQLEGPPPSPKLVDVFALTRHPQARVAYAWNYEDTGSKDIVTVLGIPPIDSALAAIKSVPLAQIATLQKAKTAPTFTPAPSQPN